MGQVPLPWGKAGDSEHLEGRQEREAKLTSSRVCTFYVMGSHPRERLVIQIEPWQFLRDAGWGVGTKTGCY